MSGTDVDGAESSGSPPAGARRRRSLEMAGLVVAIVGVVVAVLAWQLPRRTGGGGTATGTTAPVVTAGATGPTTTTVPPTTPVTASARYLTDLPPDTGGGFVQRTGAHSLLMRCGTGESDDRYREVTYVIPPAGYTSFRTTLRPTGVRDTRIEVRLSVDDAVRGDQVVTAGGSGSVEAGVTGAGRVTLRILCDPGATAVTFADPALYR